MLKSEFDEERDVLGWGSELLRAGELSCWLFVVVCLALDERHGPEHEPIIRPTVQRKGVE